jgi:hypothetical protein
LASTVITPLVPSGAPIRRFAPAAFAGEADVGRRLSLLRMAFWLRPAGFFMGIVGHDAWTEKDHNYLGVKGGEMCWSHANEATNLRWLQGSGLHVHWTRFIPEGNSGHTLVLAQKPPVS